MPACHLHVYATQTETLPEVIMSDLSCNPQDEYSEVERFSACVLPSPEHDDVVTSPFNACLSLASTAVILKARQT